MRTALSFYAPEIETYNEAQALEHLPRTVVPFLEGE